MNSSYGSPFGASYGNGDSQRQSYIQTPPHNNGFSVAGMSGLGQGSSPLSSSQWGASTSGPGLGGSLTESRSHYTAGYIMPPSQSSQGMRGHEDVPAVQTRAKMNNSFVRGSASEFGMESMFQSSRQRMTLPDEDAPPTTSVNDIMSDFSSSSRPSGFSQSTLRESALRPPARPMQTAQLQSHIQPLFVVVFGYPPEKYSITVEFFKSLGDFTEVNPSTELINCFRIGYKNPGDAMRAVRKNGDVLSGSWMVGAKWDNPAEAEMILGQTVVRSGVLPMHTRSASGGVTLGDSMSVDSSGPPGTPTSSNTMSMAVATVGTPIRLAPASSAFRKPGAPKPSTAPIPAAGLAPTGEPAAAPSPGKSLVGQVSDLIFGW